MRIVTGMERRVAPPEYSDFLSRAGGANLYGEPNFILFWGQTRTERNAFGDMLTGHGMPLWMVGLWHSCEEYGSPGQWDWNLGPYPYKGRYEIVHKFIVQDERGKNHRVPLSFRTLELLLPVIQKHRYDNEEKRRLQLRQDHERVEKETEDHIADRLQDSVPFYSEALSYAGQTNKNSAVQQRMELIKRGIGRIRPRRGLQQVSV